MLNDPPQNNSDDKQLEFGYKPAIPVVLFSDITGFIALIQACFEKVSAVHKRSRIQKLLDARDWVEHYRDKKTGRRVLSESKFIEHKHELQTAILLTKANYDVLLLQLECSMF